MNNKKNLKTKINNKIKENKAITLIALVITMIILLILAGVAISILSNNGIFERAKETKDKWQNAQNEEEMQIAKYSNEIDSYVDGNRETVTIPKKEYEILINLSSYSTTPQKVGKFLDDDLYRKTVIYNEATSGTSASPGSYEIPHSIENMNEIVKIYGIGIWTYEGKKIYTALPSFCTNLNVDDTNIQYYTAGFSCEKLLFVLEYTTR